MSLGWFDKIVQRIRDCASSLPDARQGKNTYLSMQDIALSAFSVFFTQCPSFLSHQSQMKKARGRSNAQSLFQIQQVPSDNHIRQVLDPIEPSHLHGLFDDIYHAFEQRGVLEAMKAVNQTQLIALDGTWYFSSQSENIHCENCSCMEHKKGQKTHYHSAITPVVVSPGHAEVVALKPEFIVKQDGHDKQDCEIAAAKRWLNKHAKQYAADNSTLLGDDLYAHQPFCRQALLHGFHFLFTCKPSSHTHLARWIEDLEKGGQIAFRREQHRDKRNRRETHEYRWAHGVPLSSGEAPLKVNWLEVRIIDHQGKQIYHSSWITDWEINEKNVVGLVAGARARWKIENENNNVLKTKGYHLRHNFGHGKKHLSSLLATMNLLAFALHTLLHMEEPSYRLIRDELPTRKIFFEHVRALTHYHFFENWTELLDFMMKGLEIGPYAKKA